MAALLLVLAYAVPLFVPPGPAPLILPAPGASLLERLFPGVPGWWVTVRLLCLFLAGALAASIAGAPVLVALIRPPERTRGGVPNRFLYAALGIAALQAGVAHWTPYFNRALQLGYITAFAAPTLLLAAGDRHFWVGRFRAWPWRRSAAIAAVLAAWLLLRVPVTLRSLRGVDFIDARQPFDALAQTASATFNLVAGTEHYGLSPLYLLFQGGGLVGADVLLDWRWLQLISMFWLLVAAVGVAYLAAQLVGPSAAPVATAAFLFSPWVLATPFSVVPLFLGPLLTVTLLGLVFLVERERPAWAIVAVGAIGGVAATRPPTAPVAVLAFGWVAWSLLKPPRGQGMPLAIAILSFIAVVSPHLPDLNGLRSLGWSFTSSRILWSGMEAGLFGQLSPAYARSVVFMSHAGRFDVMIGAALAAFAIPRTAVRLWGDALFDPFGAGLAALGIMACLRCAYHDRSARIVLVVLAVALLPGCVSTYDRPSLIRIVIAPVPLALLTGVGFEIARRGLGARLPASGVTAIAAGAIAVGGAVLFDVVNPRILARSAVGITLSALQRAPISPAVILTPETWDPQDTVLFAQHVAAPPRPVRAYAGLASLDGIAGPPAPELLFWSPGLEEQAEVSHGICQRWPGTALYTLFDDAHLSRAFAARPAGAGWRPPLPAAQWSVAGCDQQLDTEGSRAAAALNTAQLLAKQGRRRERLDVLRAAARRALVAHQLFETLASALLADSPSRADLDEAAYWASRACEVLGETCLQNRDRATADAARVARLVQAIAQARNDLAVGRDVPEIQRHESHQSDGGSHNETHGSGSHSGS